VRIRVRAVFWRTHIRPTARGSECNDSAIVECFYLIETNGFKSSFYAKK